MKGVKVSNFIVPMSVTDTYPTNLDIFGRGGIHSVDTIPNRDAITTERRSEGMLSFTKNNESMYALLGGITNDKWFKLFDFSGNKVNFNIACDPNYVLLGNKDGVAKPSPRLRDMQFDIIALRREFDKIGVLETLDHNRIWIGDYTNRPVMQKTIGVNNLPVLGAALFPIPLLDVSIPIPNPNFDPTSGWDYVMSSPWLNQIYAGSPSLLNTSTETVISSSLAFAQIKAAQAIKRLDNAGFIVKSKTISYSWENPIYSFVTDPVLRAAMEIYGLGTTYTFKEAQALDTLEVGLLYNDSGVLSKAIGGKHYVDIAPADFDEGFMSLLPANDDKLIRKSIIRVVDNQDVDRIRTLRAESINANKNVQAIEGVIGNQFIGSRELRFYDYQDPPRYVNYVAFKAPPLVLGTPAVTWTVPSAAGADGQVLTTDSNNVLFFKNILPDGLTNTLLAQGEVGGKSTFINATLTNGKFWKGDATNKPVETDLNFAPNDASYILKTPNNNLNSAQALSELAGGILKSAALTGIISIASGGGTVGVDDYVTPAVLTEEIEAVLAEATEAATVAGAEAGTAAGTTAGTLLFYLRKKVHQIIMQILVQLIHVLIIYIFLLQMLNIYFNNQLLD
jgi:hypothetical protein